MTQQQLPEGWTVEETRFMWALVDPTGTQRSFGLTEEICRNAIHLVTKASAYVSNIDRKRNIITIAEETAAAPEQEKKNAPPK